MRNILLLIVVILSQSVFGYGQNEYTVLAPSGLSLREGPGLNHKKVTAAPFLANVELREFDPDVYAASHEDVIDEKEGYWLPVSYQEKDGYMFSAYLKEGPLYRAAGEDGLNQDFRVTEPGIQCQPLNYDPELHWYGFYREEGATSLSIEVVKPQIEFGYAVPEEDLEMAYVDQNEFTRLEIESEKQYLFLLGSRKPIQAEQWAKSESYVVQDAIYPEYYQLGRFIYPYERMFLAQKEEPYFLVGHQHTEILEYPNRKSVPVNDYQLYLSNSPYYGLTNAEGDSLNLTKSLLEYPFLLHDQQYVMGPRLVWKGDLNGDDFPDLLFHQPNSGDSCGGCNSYYLLLSQKTKSGYNYKKVAEESIWGCFGC